MKYVNQMSEAELDEAISRKEARIEYITQRLEAYDRGEIENADETDRWQAERAVEIHAKQLADLAAYRAKKFPKTS